MTGSVRMLRPGTPAPDEVPVACPEMTARTGLSYARLDFLCRAGRLIPVPGSYPALLFSQTEARIAEVMVELGRRGFTNEAAANYARQHVEHSRVVELLPGGLTIIGREAGP